MDYFTFNFLEAIFWIGLGGIVIIVYKLYPGKYRKLAFYASIALILFGVSDILEIYLGNFLDSGMSWLFLWKIANTAAIVGVVNWYIMLRFRT